MFLGILIGFVIFGVFVMLQSLDDPHLSREDRYKLSNYRIMSYWFIIIGSSGSIGWIIEVLI